MEPLLSLKHVSKTFPVGKTILGKPDKFVHAVNDVSFDVYKGETFSIVGESGCGKSTTGRLINHLLTPDSGEIKFMGQEISHLTQDQMRPLRKDVQMIFQDPAGSLNPRMRVEDLIAEPLLIHTDMSKAERMEVVHELLGIVGLSPKHAKRYPHEFSGGQKQRIGIARALTVKPKLIIADEPISALDVSIQAQVLNLLHHLQEKFDLTYVFISHDLSVVEMISDRIAVMYLGFVVETAPKKCFIRLRCILTPRLFSPPFRFRIPATRKSGSSWREISPAPSISPKAVPSLPDVKNACHNVWRNVPRPKKWLPAIWLPAISTINNFKASADLLRQLRLIFCIKCLKQTCVRVILRTRQGQAPLLLK